MKKFLLTLAFMFCFATPAFFAGCDFGGGGGNLYQQKPNHCNYRTNIYLVMNLHQQIIMIDLFVKNITTNMLMNIKT